MSGQYRFPLAASGPGGSVGSARRVSDTVNPFSGDPNDKSTLGLAGGNGANGGNSSPTSPPAASLHGTAALTASFSVDSTIDESDPFALIQRGLNQQAHNDMWGASDSFGRASVMLKRRSDALLAKEAEHNARVRHRRDDQAAEQAAHHGKPGSNAHSRTKSAATGFAHRRSDSQSSGGASNSNSGVGTFNLEGERRSVRREAAEVFKERSREYFRQARESLIAAMAIDTKASSSSESKDSTGPDEQGVRDRCVIFRRLFAPGHTQGGVPTDSSLIQHTSYSSRAVGAPAAPTTSSSSNPMDGDDGVTAAATTTNKPTTNDGGTVGNTIRSIFGGSSNSSNPASNSSSTNGNGGNGGTNNSNAVKSIKDPFPDDDIIMQIEHEEDLRTLSRRFEELEEMAVSPQDYAPVGGDGDYHSYETSNLIDSNLEPHYSNLIDSANAPIFGVDRQGRVNVW